MRLVKKETLVDVETGEVVKEGERYVNDIVYDDNRGAVYRYNSTSVKIFRTHMLGDNYSLVEKGMFYTLIEYISSEDQLLKRRTNKGLALLDDKSFAKRVEKPVRTVREFFNKLRAEGILKKISTTDGVGYMVNPNFALLGKRLTPNVYNMFPEDTAIGINERVKSKFEYYKEVRLMPYKEIDK